MTKRMFLGVFPTLKECWELDNGRTCLSEYFEISQEKERIYRQWKQVEKDPNLLYPLIIGDVETMMIRMGEYKEDGRPEYTDEEFEKLESLEIQTHNTPVFLDRKDYLALMEFMDSHTIDDELNCHIMECRVRFAYAFKDSDAAKQFGLNEE